MSLPRAPLFTDHGPGAYPGQAHWLKTQDNVRLRIGVWGADQSKGTILIFCGRTEYVEKYATNAGDFVARGYAVVAVDWRGQGLADRLLPEGRLGHVRSFDDYQTDVAAVRAGCAALELPQPVHLLGHSMGGCIALRSLADGFPAQAAAFTGPMWGINLNFAQRLAAWVAGRAFPVIGLGNILCPTTKIRQYILTEPFEDNMLTPYRPAWDILKQQVLSHPELEVGGPTVRWLHAALQETAELAQTPSPKLPCITFLGDNERIVDVDRVRTRMATWENGRLEILKNNEHEVLMMDDKTRNQRADQIVEVFDNA